MGAVFSREVRKYIIDRLVETARAPHLEEIMQQFRLSRDEAVRRLEELQAAHHLLLLPGTRRILMVHPFSNLPTPFGVVSGSHRYFANCAWDAIALHVVLDRDVRIHSFCHHCGASIEFGLSRRARVDEEGRDVLVFLGTPVSRWYDNLVNTCSNTMVFFASRHHWDEWQRDHPETRGETFTVDRMIEVVTPISTARATREYQMPSKAELMAHWASIGLRGPFWTF
jgi:Alkylmercury lyase